MKIYVIQVRTRAEEKFLTLARRALKTSGLEEGVGTFHWPRRQVTIRRKGRKLPSQAPIFPGYIFLEAEEVTPGVYWTLKGISGFFQFLKSNRAIEPLTGSDKRLLLHFLSFGEILGKSKIVFDKNKRIRVLEGPLKGLEGLIVKVDRRKGRAKVKLSLYENSFLVDFSFDVIEGVKDT